MKNKNDEKFSSASESSEEEHFENQKNDRFIEKSDSGQSQNPANRIPLSSKNSELIGGVRTSAAVAKQKKIEKSRKKQDATLGHKVVQDQFASDPGKNLPPRS